MTKQAFVLPRTALVDSGIIPANPKNQALYVKLHDEKDLSLLLRLAEQYGSYRERGGKHDVEQDPSVQQVIVYGYIQLTDGRFMLYQRGGDVYSESRLAGKVSLGIGGHMEPADLSLMDSFYRELAEETLVTESGKLINFMRPDDTADVELMRQYLTVTPVGLIKDERDEVGKMHLGVACRLTPRSSVEISIHPEGGKHIKSFYVDINQYDVMTAAGEITPEGWTNIVIDNELRTDNTP